MCMKFFQKVNRLAAYALTLMTNRPSQEIRQLLQLAFPIMGTQLAQSANSVVDTVMAGQISATDLAAVALGCSFWVPLYLFMAGVCLATTPLVAQHLGARQPQLIRQQVHHSLWVALLLSVICIVLLQQADHLLPLFANDPQLIQLTTGYLFGLSFGVPAAVLCVVLRCVYEAASQPLPVLIISVISLLINIPLNSIFMWGWGPIPALGGAGCGWATSIALWVMLFLLCWQLGRNPVLKNFNLLWPTAKWVLPVPDWQKLWRTLKLGLPIGCSIFFEISIFSVIALFIAKYGVDTVAAHQIALNFASMLFMVPLSISMALTVQLGFALGANQHRQARQIIHAGFYVNISIAVLITGSLLLLHTWIPQIYTQEASVQKMAGYLLLWAAAFQIVDALQVTSNGLLRGFQDTRYSMMMTLIAYWVIGLPIGYLVAQGYLGFPAWQVYGYWLGLVAGLGCAALILIKRVHKLSWQYLQ